MLSNRQDLIDLRAVCVRSVQKPGRKILVCAGTGCVSSGSLALFDRLASLLKERDIECEVAFQAEPHVHSVGLKKSGCHGFCELGPLIRIDPEGWLYTKVSLADCEEIIEKSILHGEPI